MDEEMVHVVVIQFEINLFNRKKVMKNIILFKIWGANNLKKLDAFQCFVLVSENLPGFSRTFRRWSNPLRWFRRSWGRRRTGRPVAGRQPWQEFRAGSNTWKNKRPIVKTFSGISYRMINFLFCQSSCLRGDKFFSTTVVLVTISHILQPPSCVRTQLMVKPVTLF